MSVTYYPSVTISLDSAPIAKYVALYGGTGQCREIEVSATALFGGGGGGGGATTLDALTDVDTTGVSAGEVLLYSGGNWVPGAINFASSGGTDVSFYAYRNRNENAVLKNYNNRKF